MHFRLILKFNLKAKYPSLFVSSVYTVHTHTAHTTNTHDIQNIGPIVLIFNEIGVGKGGDVQMNFGGNWFSYTKPHKGCSLQSTSMRKKKLNGHKIQNTVMIVLIFLKVEVGIDKYVHVNFENDWCQFSDTKPCYDFLQQVILDCPFFF